MIRRGGLFLLLALVCPAAAFAQSVTITSPLAGSLDHGTITVSAANNPSSDYDKWYGPKLSSGACAAPFNLEPDGNCTDYNSSFSFDTSQLPDGPSGFYVQEFNNGHLDAAAQVNYTIGTPTPSPTPSPAPTPGTFSFTSPTNGSSVSGTINVTVVNYPAGTNYIKFILPNQPVSGSCAFGQFDSATQGCSLYTGATFTYNTATLLANGTGYKFSALPNGQRPVITTVFNVSNGGGTPSPTPTASPSPSPIPTPSPTASPTPTKTSTPTSTATSTPTATTSASPTPTATGTPAGLAAALLDTMGADFRIVTDQGAYGADWPTAQTNAAQMLAYLGLPMYRTDFTCDAVTFGPNCDSRNVVSSFLNTLPYKWVVLPFTGGAMTSADTATNGFLIGALQQYKNLGAVEDGNEINNTCPTFTYNGVTASCSGNSWAGGAAFSKDYYTSVKSVYGPNMPVFSWINPAFDITNDGLQYAGVNTTPSNLPVIADYADVHNYPNFNGSVPPDFVVTTAFELGTGGPDNGMSGNFCQTTVTGGFPTYGSTPALCNQIPRVATEFGIQFTKTSEEQKAAIDTNFYVIGYLRGWTTYNSLYAIADTTTGYGVFESAMPQVQTATSFAIHNLSTWLKGVGSANASVCPAITGNAAATDYAMCGSNWMLATGDRASGEHIETWTLNVPSTATWTDMVTGTTGTGNTISVDDHLVGVSW